MLDKHQKQRLRALAHDRKPVVIIGDKGLTESVLAELEAAITHHELVKVRVNASERDARDACIATMVERLGAELVQRIGHVATLFRRNAKRPGIFP